MSPQHFKGFLRAASEILTAYEKNFGELTIPDQDTKPTRTAAEITDAVQTARAVAKSFSTAQPQPSLQSDAEPQPKEKRP
jgi:hypothetical protein